jgi:hypothetical protein
MFQKALRTSLLVLVFLTTVWMADAASVQAPEVRVELAKGGRNFTMKTRGFSALAGF